MNLTLFEDEFIGGPISDSERTIRAQIFMGDNKMP